MICYWTWYHLPCAGKAGLRLCSVLIYGVIIYSQDLKNKTGYMVFMTPISNYKIIGAKLLSILLTGATLVAFLGLLIVVDYNLLKSHNGGVAGAEIVLDEIAGVQEDYQ